MTATTVAPRGGGDNPTITYTGYADGSYGTDSAYNMYSSAQSYDSSGTFTGTGAVTSFTNEYSDPSITQEHVHLHLTDSVDQANGTADYYVNFHEPLENWHENATSPVVYPANHSPTYSSHNFEGWNLEGPWYNPGPENMSHNFSTSTGSAASVTGSITNTFGVTLGSDIASALFQQNQAYTLGKTYSVLTVQTTSYTIPPNYSLYLFWAPGINHHTGTVDEYSTDGYDGGTWVLDVPQSDPDGGLVILVEPDPESDD